MTDHHPADRPGHLDIDAVSAFIDRDLDADELTTIEFHLHECPACHREVLEIRTTVVLLAGLPQYTPRRSFCLGHEHARASRRRLPRGHFWSGPFASAGYPASAASSVAHAEAGRAAGWLPGLQAAAVVIGALLLLVTTSDLLGMPPQPAEWLSDPGAPVQQLDFRAAPAPESAPPAVPAPEAAGDSDVALAPAGSNPEPSFNVASNPSEGTTSDNSASEEMLEDEETANTGPSVATSAALAAVTRAVPTPGAGLARSPETATADADAPAATDAQPSRLRLAQLALAFALAWLVVTIVGLRWVRGLRRASS
jgi:anti-sigma factor RsiW